MSKVIKAVSGVFGGADVSRNASQIGGEQTPEQLAEKRAALAAQGRRPKEEELRRQKSMGTRPLQGGMGRSSMWS